MHRYPLSLPIDFIGLLHTGHIGFSLVYNSAKVNISIFSKLTVRPYSVSNTPPYAITVSPLESFLIIFLNPFVGSYAADKILLPFDISKNTLANYLKVLEDLFITNETEAWNPNFRSATAIRQSNTRYLADPSITTAALKMGPEDLLNDLQTFGLIFETLCVRDLKVYAQVLDADILHYRDAAGLECDAVFYGRNGKYGLIEIKLGQNRVEEGATNMLRLEKKIAASNQKIPDFLMVLTGTGFAHRREDGVYVVPIGCLKP